MTRYYANALAGEVLVLSERFHKHLIPDSAQHPVNRAQRDGPEHADRPAPRPAGEIVGTISVIKDVTERVVSERELRNQIAASERARERRGRSVKTEGRVSGDDVARDPDAVERGAGMGRASCDAQPRLKTRDHALEVIERNAASQLRLVEDLLDMARVISGKLRLELKTIALEDVVRAAVDVVTPRCGGEKHHDLDFVRRRDGPRSTETSIDMQQAIWNLMSNAIKFTEPGVAWTSR